MNYTELITKFWGINEKSPLGASAIALYLFLLEEYRKNNGKDFTISDNVISQKLSLTRRTINALKSKLRNIGLIQYQAQNGLPSIYRIISNFSFLQQELPKKETVKIKNETNQEPISTEQTPEIPINKTLEQPIQTNNIQSQILEEKTIHTSTRENIKIPTLEEFMNFAKSLEIYDETMDFAIKSKYESWRDNGWVNGLGLPINKWQNNLKNTLPHLKTSKKKPSGLQPNNIPTIKRPKQTYNE
jgi:hypothetical protein